MRSQPIREVAYAFFAASRSPALTASTNALVVGMVSSACVWTYLRYSATAASSSGLRFSAAPLPVALTFWRMPSPFMPGLQAIS